MSDDHTNRQARGSYLLVQTRDTAGDTKIAVEYDNSLLSDSQISVAHADLSVIIVPDIEDRHVSKKTASAHLSQTLQTIAPEAQCFIFHYSSCEPGLSIWHTLVRRGVEFLHSLVREATRVEALTILSQQYQSPPHRRILDALVGIIFLGTPHITHSDLNKWAVLQHILKLRMKVPKDALAEAEAGHAMIADLSASFEDAGISLVDRDLAETAVKNERLVASNADHNDICCIIKESSLYDEVALLFEAVRSVPATPISTDDSGSNSPPTERKTIPENFSTYERQSANIPYREAKRAPRLPCYCFASHTRDSEFFGQSHVMTQLDEALLPLAKPDESSAERLRSFAICGVGGLGKTQIALEYAFSRESKFDAIFFICADSHSKIAESFSLISTKLGLSDQSVLENRTISRRSVMQWLSNPSRDANWRLDVKREADAVGMANWLIIFDNADDLSILRDYWPVGGRGAILITSRDPLAKTYLYSGVGVDLEPFSPTDGGRLLQRLSRQDNSEEVLEEAVELCNRLGGFPLAIARAAAIILRRDLTVKEFLRMYDEEMTFKDLCHETIRRPQDRYQHTLSSVWAFDILDAAAMALLDVVSLFDSESILETILSPQCYSASDGLIKEYPFSSTCYAKARTDLLKSSLVKRNKTSNQLMLHQLVQDVVRARMAPDRLQRVFEFAVSLLYQAWPKAHFRFAHKTPLWEASEQVLPHVLRLHQWWKLHKAWDLGMITKQNLTELILNSAWYLRERGNSDSAHKILKQALAICEESDQQMPKLFADALFCLSSVSSELNKCEEMYIYARRHLMQRLKVENQQELSLDVGMAYSEMGFAFYLNDMYEKAIECCDRSSAIYKKTPEFLSGEYWPHFAISHRAWALLGLGRGGEAVQGLLDTLRWRESKYGKDDTESASLAITLHVLGRIRAQQGLWAESIDALQRALISYRATVGNSYYKTAAIRVTLAENLARFEPQKARYFVHPDNMDLKLALTCLHRAYFEQALEIYALHSFCKPQYARTHMRMARFFQSQGNSDCAEKHRSQANSIYFEIVKGHRIRDRLPDESDFDKIVTIIYR
ncbi:MAG: hypothetical protein Q9195_004974 [Heterodermia aff. obscurata]